jgi:hypothetical protein
LVTSIILLRKEEADGIRNTTVSETEFLFYPNTTKFLIFWYFIKTIALLQNYKNTLYPNRAL